MSVITTIDNTKSCCPKYEELLLKEVILAYCGVNDIEEVIEEPVEEPVEEPEVINCDPSVITFTLPRPKLILTESITVPSVSFPGGQTVFNSETEKEFIENVATSMSNIGQGAYESLVNTFKETGAKVSGGGLIGWNGYEDSLNPVHSISIQSSGRLDDFKVHSGTLKSRPADSEGKPDVIYLFPTDMHIALIIESEFARYFTSSWQAMCQTMESLLPNYERKTVIELLRGTKQELPLDTDVSNFGSRFGEIMYANPSKSTPPEVIMNVGTALMIGEIATTTDTSKVDNINRATTVAEYMKYLDSKDEFVPYTNFGVARIEIVKAIVFTYEDSRFNDSTKAIFVDYGLSNKYLNLGEYVNGII